MLNPCFNLIELAHMSVGRAVTAGSLVVDATMGNGYDTIFLAKLVGARGRVLAFETQRAALEKTAVLLQEAGFSQRVSLLHTGHEHMAQYLSPGQAVSAVMFNLGFLPGGNRQVVTNSRTTLAALNGVQGFIKPGGGLLSIHCYSGHEGGAQETQAVLAWARQLPRKQWWAYCYNTYNKQTGAENLLLIERL